MQLQLTRRAVAALLLPLAARLGRPAPARAAVNTLSCPSWKPTQSGCVSSAPSGAPNREVAPLTYSGDRDREYSRLRACLLAKPDASLLDEQQGAVSMLRVRLPSLEASQRGLFEELTFRFLPDEPVVAVRILAERPYPSQPFCVTPGCIVGNAAQRRRLETIRDEVGFTSTSEPTAEGRWVPIFLNGGTSLDADDDR